MHTFHHVDPACLILSITHSTSTLFEPRPCLNPMLLWVVCYVSVRRRRLFWQSVRERCQSILIVISRPAGGAPALVVSNTNCSCRLCSVYSTVYCCNVFLVKLTFYRYKSHYKSKVRPEPHGPTGQHWSPFPVALSRTPAEAARPRIMWYARLLLGCC